MRARGVLLFVMAACGGGGEAAVDVAPPDPPDATPAPPDALCLAPAPDAEPTPAGCPVRLPPAPDRLDEALALAGLDRCTLGYTDGDLAILPASILADPDRL